MATIRDGEQDVLLVVDVQRGVVANAHDRDGVVSRLASAVDRARTVGVPIVWVQHSDEELERGSEAWELVPELVPAADEPRIEKTYHSSFEDTGLDGVLEELGATHLIVGGAATNWCIRATSYGALDRGYDLTLIEDGHTTEDIEFEDGHVIPASNVIDDLNATMRWIGFPGRTSATAKAEALFI